jgi:error-prone DNA polymerase
MTARYVELRAHSAFSFGAAAVTPETLAVRAKELGYPSLGLTDCADLGGTVRFVCECHEQGVRPVVGCELVVDGHPLALLARTCEGYRNIAALVTRARAGELREWAREDAGARAGAPPRGFPSVAWRDVAERSAGLVLLTGPASGHLGTLVRRGDRGAAARRLAEWRDAFGEHLAVEVQWHHAGRTEEALAGALIAFAERERARWVVAGDARYIDGAGRRAFDVLTALRHGCTIDEAAERGLLLPNDTWALESPDDVAARWSGRGAGIEASAEIAAACGGERGFELAWVRPPLPDVPVPRGHDMDSLLRERVYEGASERWRDGFSRRHEAQLDHELRVIGRLGFAGFFLIMCDVVREARRRGILCQGRGSAANSAVAYCLGVTAVDPVKHGLLFERFLSEARAGGLTEAPDIDVDIEHDRREELLDHMYAKYGRAHAAITCVVQTYSASTAVQDVCRAYGVSVETTFALSKRVHRDDPADGAARLREGLAAEHGLDAGTPRGAALLEAIAAFEGLPRMRSTHPGGFVLSSARLGDYCPVEPTTMGRTIIQYDKDDLDAVGIPKYDLLGLGALSAVRRAFDVLETRTGARPEMYALPQDDPETFAMIARGDTIGMFQIESRAQISSLVHTRPERMYDIVVQVALIRPGPIVAKFVRPYTERRRGRAIVEYPPGLEARLDPILGRTQGIPIFQEQAMAMSMALGGYSAMEADELRRTMGHDKKLPRLMRALDRLRERMIAEGIAPDAAEQLSTELLVFGNYGFPESHAWSFALIAYATAYLKAHHPTEFYLGLLNAQPMGFYSVASLVHDARRHGVEVRSPCLRGGAVDCTVEETDDPARPALRVGWRFVRGIGDVALERLAATRSARAFTSIEDVVRRAKLVRAEASALARAHAFAAWEPERRRAAWEALRAAGDTMPLAPSSAASREEEVVAHHDGYAPRPLDRAQAIIADYHALGLSTAGHPMERFRPWCERVGAIDSEALQRCRGGERVIVAGLVTVRQRPGTAHGTVFLLLEDERGSANVIVSRARAEQHREAVNHAQFLAVYGRAERDGPMVNLIAMRFQPLDASVIDAPAEQELVYRSHDFH